MRKAKSLLKHGANINAVGTNAEIRKPASMLAGLLHEPFDSNEHRSKRIVEFFLAHGFDPKANNGKTGAQVLAYLICFTHPEEELLETISLLRDAGADPACAYETIDVTEDEYYSDTCNGICNGDPKNALNCAYPNMAFSEHDYFDLWSPCAFWTAHRLFDKATRKKNYRAFTIAVLVWASTSVRYTLSAKNTLLCLYAPKNQSTLLIPTQAIRLNLMMPLLHCGLRFHNAYCQCVSLLLLR